MSNVRLGTMNWAHPSWTGSFYPESITTGEMLSFYSGVFRTVELEETFFSLPAEPLLRVWYESVPDDFRFACRLNQKITHERRFEDVETSVNKFLQRMACLEHKLGPIVIQLPIGFAPTPGDREKLEDFLQSLSSQFHWVVEFRDPAWFDERMFTKLAESNHAAAIVDGRWVRHDIMAELATRPTSDFVYLRWRADGFAFKDHSRVTVDREDRLETWARILGPVSEDLPVFGYFDNDFEGHAPQSCVTMEKLMLRAEGMAAFRH